MLAQGSTGIGLHYASVLLIAASAGVARAAGPARGSCRQGNLRLVSLSSSPVGRFKKGGSAISSFFLLLHGVLLFSVLPLARAQEGKYSSFDLGEGRAAAQSAICR